MGGGVVTSNIAMVFAAAALIAGAFAHIKGNVENAQYFVLVSIALSLLGRGGRDE